MTYEAYKVTISAEGIAEVAVLLDADPATVQSGYGGWTVVSRQRRVGLTVWEGKDPLRWQIPVLFDGVETRLSQEIPISRLSRMALPPTTGGEPPQVRISGRGLQNVGPTLWVIENLSWGRNVIKDFASNGVMARLRQDCIINLLEYRGDDRVAFRGIRPGSVTSASHGGSKSGWPKTHKIKQGETLRSISLIYYHTTNKWNDIAKANSIRDPNVVSNKSYVGKSLRIPAP